MGKNRFCRNHNFIFSDDWNFTYGNGELALQICHFGFRRAIHKSEESDTIWFCWESFKQTSRVYPWGYKNLALWVLIESILHQLIDTSVLHSLQKLSWHPNCLKIQSIKITTKEIWLRTYLIENELCDFWWLVWRTLPRCTLFLPLALSSTWPMALDSRSFHQVGRPVWRATPTGHVEVTFRSPGKCRKSDSTVKWTTLNNHGFWRMF